MLSTLLIDHALALLLLWAWVTFTGLALLPCLRIRVGLVGAPLVGVVYWTLALYLLPFSGGLDLAAGVVMALLSIHLYQRWPHASLAAGWRRLSGSTLILLLGSVPYLTTLLYHYVPTGMDASMYTTGATLIARSRGLPSDHAPFAPDVPFVTVNLGLPSVAAVAIRCGGEPAAVMLASHHLTFTCLILATYLLLRRWTPRMSAAVIAVASVWLARASQASLGWGGFPTVLSVAVGVFASRLLLQHARSSSWRLSLATGAAVAAIPLIHGVGGATWIYCAGIWIVVATLRNTGSLSASLRGLAQTGMCAVLFLLSYRLVGTLDVESSAMDATYFFVQQHAPTAEGWQIWPAALSFVRKDAGTLVTLAGWAACAFLAYRRRWGAALILTAAWLTLITVVANARWLILPGSFLLYPDRTLYWSGPLTAIALALAWRSAPLLWRRSPCAVALALGMLVVAGYFHNQFYQRIVGENTIDRDGWAALVWCRQHLDPEKHFVEVAYNTTGSYLPSIAQIGCTGLHYHHFIARQIQQAHGQRIATHRFVDTNALAEPASGLGKIVFRNVAITIIELPDRTVSIDRRAGVLTAFVAPSKRAD